MREGQYEYLYYFKDNDDNNRPKSTSLDSEEQSNITLERLIVDQEAPCSNQGAGTIFLNIFDIF